MQSYRAIRSSIIQAQQESGFILLWLTTVVYTTVFLSLFVTTTKCNTMTNSSISSVLYLQSVDVDDHFNPAS